MLKTPAHGINDFTPALGDHEVDEWLQDDFTLGHGQLVKGMAAIYGYSKGDAERHLYAVVEDDSMYLQ